jgi:putative transposase
MPSGRAATTPFERQTCQVLGIASILLRYEVRKRNEDGVRLALIQLAMQYGRYGYRKVGQHLRMAGWCFNHKKVERIWRDEGLKLPQRHKRRKCLYHHNASVIRLMPHFPNHIWSSFTAINNYPPERT